MTDMNENKENNMFNSIFADIDDYDPVLNGWRMEDANEDDGYAYYEFSADGSYHKVVRSATISREYTVNTMNDSKQNVSMKLSELDDNTIKITVKVDSINRKTSEYFISKPMTVNDIVDSGKKVMMLIDRKMELIKQSNEVNADIYKVLH